MFFLALAEQTAEKNKTRTHNKTEPLSVMRGMRVNFPVHFRLLLLRYLPFIFISTQNHFLLHLSRKHCRVKKLLHRDKIIARITIKELIFLMIKNKPESVKHREVYAD